MRRFLFLSLVFLFSLAGCRPIEKKTAKSGVRMASGRILEPEHWTRYVYGPSRESVYVNQDTRNADDGDGQTVYWVYDQDFQQVGYYTEFGNTYRLDHDGEQTRLGQFPPDRSVLKIVGGTPPIQQVELVEAGQLD